MRIFIPLLLFLGTLPAHAQDLPACARSGSKGVMFNGLPALRLSDVQACPPGSYSIVNGFLVDGEPVVQFKPVGEECVAGASPNVIINGQAANRVGDVVCQQKK